MNPDPSANEAKDDGFDETSDPGSETGAGVSYRSPTYYELKAPPELDWRPYRPESWFRYREEWDERPVSGDPGDFPLHLDLDPTNRCNLGCVMCPRTAFLASEDDRWAPNGFGDMDFRLFERLVGEGAENGLRSVKLNFLGEPLLYPKLPEMIKFARDRGLWVMLNTNAVLLTRGMSEKLLASGLTDAFFSFDSPYEREYERVRVGAEYGKTLENIRVFAELKNAMGLRHVQTRAGMILSEDPRGREKTKADFISLFRGLGVAEIGFGLPTVPGKDYSPLNPKGFFRCPDLFRRVFVFHDGVAGPCCGDWVRSLIVGDANRSTLKEIWRSGVYGELRESHLAGDYGKVPTCRACSVPYLSRLGDV
ncbi:MAG: radical SAM protein [Deltaproteobacteria bacterium]|jgi:hypothetical protein|nr:radical SAM protein [Deltaproteobacteria bacterium]